MAVPFIFFEFQVRRDQHFIFIEVGTVHKTPRVSRKFEEEGKKGCA